MGQKVQLVMPPSLMSDYDHLHLDLMVGAPLLDRTKLISGLEPFVNMITHDYACHISLWTLFCYKSSANPTAVDMTGWMMYL